MGERLRTIPTKAQIFSSRAKAPGEHIQRRFREQCHPILIGKGGHGCCSGNSLRHISRQASKRGCEIRGLTDCSSSVHPSRDKKLRDATFRKNHSREPCRPASGKKQRALVLLISFFRLGETQENGRREFGDVSDPTDRISQIGRRYWSSNQRDLRYSSLCSCGLSSQTARSLGWRRSANEPGWLLTFFSFPAPAFCFSCVHNRLLRTTAKW